MTDNYVLPKGAKAPTSAPKWQEVLGEVHQYPNVLQLISLNICRWQIMRHLKELTISSLLMRKGKGKRDS